MCCLRMIKFFPLRLRAMNTIELILTHVMLAQNSKDITQLSAIEVSTRYELHKSLDYG